MKAIIKKFLASRGYQLVKNRKSKAAPQPGSELRPVGNMKYLLEDLRQRGLKCSSFIDVGANNTAYSRMVKEVFPEAAACLIEPQQEMLPHLENFAATFAHTVFFLAGAGAKKGKLTLTVWDDLAGSSFLPGPDEKLREIDKQREIDIITIDDLINERKIEMPQFIKLDVQGFELEVLKGASKAFGETEVFILEVSLFASDSPDMPVFAEVVNFMAERDYVVYDFPGFLRRPADGALAQCDLCFVKKEGMFRKSNSWN